MMKEGGKGGRRGGGRSGPQRGGRGVRGEMREGQGCSERGWECSRRVRRIAGTLRGGHWGRERSMDSQGTS